MFQASQEGKDYDLRDILKDTLVEHHPDLAVTIVDNHDTQRGSSLESNVEDWFKPLAYGLILLMKEGYPCLFYGDYYGIKGRSLLIPGLLIYCWMRDESTLTVIR